MLVDFNANGAYRHYVCNACTLPRFVPPGRAAYGELHKSGVIASDFSQLTSGMPYAR